LPFISRDGELLGFQGRAFKKSSLRYITVKVDENAPKIFGLDTINVNRTVYIVEGPIDSLFLSNSIAMGGADLSPQSIDRIGSEDLVFVFDNEPRNKEIVKRIENIIELGYNISLFPEYIQEKDINDMVLSGTDIDEIRTVISNNTFSGLSAKAKLSEWRKV
jgi:DNA primase